MSFLKPTRAGFRVAVLERERFPREHIGESLLPIAFLALDQMGITDKVLQAGFVRKYGATYIWGRSRDDWFWQARRIVDPSQSFSLQQAFSLIAAGVSRSPGATSHLKLKHAGGFSPEQLKVIYQNFELELSDEQQEQLEDYLEEERQARDYQPVTTERLLNGIPEWIEGVKWQPYMLNDQEDVLRPATLVEIPDGDNTKTHFLSIAATSLLRQLDGSRTGQQIVDDAMESWGAAVGKSTTAVQTLVADTLKELHAEGALTVA